MAHKDIKLENILIDSKFDMTLADFGLSAPIDREDEIHCGTRGYMAPEILRRDKFDNKNADLFALGVILFSLRTGWGPFVEAKRSDPYYKLII